MANAVIKKVISYLLIASIFITGESLIASGFDLYWYYIVYLLFAVYGLVQYHRVSKPALLGLFVVTIYSCITYQYGLDLVFKQVLNIAFVLLVFYNFIIFEEYDYVEIFKKYVDFSKAILIIGFIQVLMFAVRLDELYLTIFPFLAKSNISCRLQSIAQEPSFIANTFAPVVFLSFYNLFRRQSILINKVWSVLFIIGYLLTLSSVAYAGMMVMIIVLYAKNFSLRKVFVGVLVLISLGIIGYTLYRSIPDVRLRIDDTMFAIDYGFERNNNYRNVNASTYALLSNVYVTEKSLQENFWTGNGLGTYKLTYDRFMPSEMTNYLVLNREDANSMTLRLLTETGFLGFLVFMFFVLKYKVRSRPSFTLEEEVYWIINSGIFVMIVLILIRSGHYTVHGRVLFLLLYYYSYRSVKYAQDARHISHLPA